MDWDELEAAVLAGTGGQAAAVQMAVPAVAPQPLPDLALRAPPPPSAAVLLQLRCLSAAHEPGCMRCVFC